MPKLKTKKAVAKRFKLTKTRKIKFFRGGKSHLNTGKQPERLRKLRRAGVLEGQKEVKFLKRTLPYG